MFDFDSREIAEFIELANRALSWIARATAAWTQLDDDRGERYCASLEDAAFEMYLPARSRGRRLLEKAESRMVEFAPLLANMGEAYQGLKQARKDFEARQPELVRRRILAENAAMGPAAKLANDKSGKHAAIRAIHAEWKRRKDAGMKFSASSFALDMAKTHGFLVSVGYLKNCQTDWNKEYHPAS